MNPYLYVRNNPINAVDPLGLVTILVTTYNGGVETHSGLYVTRDGNRFLYDPEGSYRSATRGSGGYFEGAEANIGDYINYHNNGGSDVDVTVLNTTPEQEQRIMDTAMEQGDPRGLSCANAVSGALGGVCGISASGFPGSLNDNAKNSSCVCR